MAENATESARREWVRSVLGIEIGKPPATSGAASGAADWKQAREAWDEAIEVVNRQIAQLQRVMKATDDEDLHEIAEYGLNALTGNRRVKLMAALMEIGDGAPDRMARARGKALAAIRGLRAHLDSDAQVRAFDSNPFGVAVSIRATLGGALDGLKAALGSAPA